MKKEVDCFAGKRIRFFFILINGHQMRMTKQERCRCKNEIKFNFVNLTEVLVHLPRDRSQIPFPLEGGVRQ